MEQLEIDRPVARDDAAADREHRTPPAASAGRSRRSSSPIPRTSDRSSAQRRRARGLRLHQGAGGARLPAPCRGAGGALRDPLPGNVTFHTIPSSSPNLLLDRLRYMLAIRRLLQRLRLGEPIDVVHQMNPVFAGLSLGLAGCGLPVVLGTFVARWPEERAELGAASAGAGCRRAVDRQPPPATAGGASSPHHARRPRPGAAGRASPAQDRHHPSWRRRVAVLAGIGPERQGCRQPPSILFYAHVDGAKASSCSSRLSARWSGRCPRAVYGGGARRPHGRVRAGGGGVRLRRPDPHPRPGRRDQAPELFRSHTRLLPALVRRTLRDDRAGGDELRHARRRDRGRGLMHIVPPSGGFRVPPGDAKRLPRRW